MNKVRKTIKFEDCASEVPIVKFILGNGEPAYAVIDTGSEATLFEMNLVLGGHKKEFPIHKTKDKINFVGLQKDTETPIIKTSPTLRFLDSDNDTEYLYVKVDDGMFISLKNLTEHLKDQYGTDMTVFAIIGSDVLNRLNAEVNYKNKEMIIDYDLSCQQ